MGWVLIGLVSLALSEPTMHYKRAPITEALIDIRVDLPSGSGFEKLKEIERFVTVDYPKTQVRNRGEAAFHFGAEVKATAQQEPWGIFFYSSDEKQVLQTRMDGFTFSRLEPYETWEKLRDEAKPLWKIYQDVARPTKITRVAVRYINQFHFPGIVIEPEDYLKTYPTLSPDLPKDLRNIGPFLVRLTLFQPDLKGTLIINEALTEPKKPQTLSVILDLDLFVAEPEFQDDASIWGLLEQFHVRKNLYFEACLTDKTRELIA